MDIEAFPEIESFQKLPRQVIVKAGNISFDHSTGATVGGIVINNSGHGIREMKVHIVIFDENKLPVLSTSLQPDPDRLPQGGITNFSFVFRDYQKAIADYYLYTRWRFDDDEE